MSIDRRGRERHAALIKIAAPALSPLRFPARTSPTTAMTRGLFNTTSGTARSRSEVQADVTHRYVAQL